MFTDNDLNQLKQKIAEGIEPGFRWNGIIERLEAAEWCVQELERADRHGNMSSDFIEPLEAWRKIAGKE